MEVKKAYSDEFDAYYNLETLEWLEPKCSDAECQYCTKRPTRAYPDEEGLIG